MDEVSGVAGGLSPQNFLWGVYFPYDGLVYTYQDEDEVDEVLETYKRPNWRDVETIQGARKVKAYVTVEPA